MHSGAAIHMERAKMMFLSLIKLTLDSSISSYYKYVFVILKTGVHYGSLWTVICSVYVRGHVPSFEQASPPEPPPITTKS